jgi:hypothetical protein
MNRTLVKKSEVYHSPLLSRGSPRLFPANTNNHNDRTASRSMAFGNGEIVWADVTASIH